MVTGIRPIDKVLDVAMFDRIVVNVVKSCPESVFVADASVPIIVPDFSAAFSLPAVDGK